jgi:hypothetical protein
MSDGDPRPAARKSDSTPDDLASEVERLRAERDTLATRLAKRESSARRRKRFRRWGTVALVVLSCLLLTVTAPAIWTYRTVMNTDYFVDRVTPIGYDPEVTPVLSDRLTTQIFGILDVDGIVAEALPPRGQILAGPLTSAVEDFVQERVNQVLSSDQFRVLWTGATRFAHEQIVAVLRDESDVVGTEGGRVVLNLLPVINEALRRIETRASGLFQREVDLPQIESGELPDAARERISTALGVDVPEDFGEIVVFESDRLAAAQDAVKLIDRGVLLLIVLTIVSVVAALWLSPSRRRTLLQLTIGTLVGLVVVRRAVRWLEDELVDLAQRPDGRRALTAITDQVFGSFFAVTALIIVIGFVIIVIAAVTGPYPWATRTRAKTRALAQSVVQAAGSPTRGEATVAWVIGHREVLQIAGAAAFVLILLLFNLSWLAVLLLLALLGAYELALYRMGAGGAPA